MGRAGKLIAMIIGLVMISIMYHQDRLTLFEFLVLLNLDFIYWRLVKPTT